MVLEATMIAVDNSDYMRNGDFIPTRLQAQCDAVSLVCQSKRQSHPENTVGLMTLSRCEVLCTLTNEVSKLYTRMHLVHPKGEISFVTGVRVAHLALRHRQSRNQKMRIIVFVGSPVKEDDKELIRLAKRLKKEKVQVDVINFGEDEVNQAKLAVFVETVNGKDGSSSHLVTVPAGAMLHDSLVSSPVILGEDGSGAVPGMGMEFGVDPNEDPELALALRVSMEDQRMRQEREAAAQRQAQGETEGTVQSALPDTAGTNEEDLLGQALAMSVADGMSPPTMLRESAPREVTPMDFAGMTEDEQIAYALRMSLQQAEEQQKGAEKQTHTPMEVEQESEAVPASSGTGGEEDLDAMYDPAFLQSVLESLPGVDPQSEEIRNAIGSLTGGGKTDDQSKEKKKEEDK